jgi:hypothetical protein
METFSVFQFFDSDNYEEVRSNVDASEAMKAFVFYTSSIGARIGTTKRVIVTDKGDCINAEWIYGKGLVYPPPPSNNAASV